MNVSEGATRVVLQKKLFLKFFSQYSHENTCVGFNFIEKRLKHRCFPVNIVKFLRTLILKNICKRLILMLKISNISLESWKQIYWKPKEWFKVSISQIISSNKWNTVTLYTKNLKRQYQNLKKCFDRRLLSKSLVMVKWN